MNKIAFSKEDILNLKQILNSKDSIIGFPTDTVWGIGCLPANQAAVKKIYSAKSRPDNKPLILLGCDFDSLVPYIKYIPDPAKELIQKHWPGALTIVLKKSDLTPDFITSNFDTVGIRIPNHPILLEFLDKYIPGKVLATTSANISGNNAPKNKQEVLKELGVNVDYILNDYGYQAKGIESTVVKFDENGKMAILRQGSIDINK